MSKKTAEPETIEMRVSRSWINFISFCQNEVPFGKVSVQMENGQPTDLLDFKRKVRFDRTPTIPEKFNDDL